jgi:molybdopterin converting factor subunit 1
MKNVKVLFFATLKARVGVSQISQELAPDARVRDLKQTLAERFPDLREMLPTVLVAVNREFAFEEDLIPPEAEIALFPPVSGG